MEFDRHSVPLRATKIHLYIAITPLLEGPFHCYNILNTISITYKGGWKRINYFKRNLRRRWSLDSKSRGKPFPTKLWWSVCDQYIFGVERAVAGIELNYLAGN